MRKSVALVLAVAIIAVAIGYAAHKALSGKAEKSNAASRLLQLSLPDIYGNPSKLPRLPNKVLVINFWATWCEPCKEEIPALMRIHRKYADNGVQIVGIAVDSADKVRKFYFDFGMNYTVLIGGVETMDLVRELGNRAGGLPFTLVFDRTGNITIARLGSITEAELERAIKTLL